MTYEETLAYLYSRLPVFQQKGAGAIKHGLANSLALSKALGQPERYFKSIHVAGTNGKGSSSHMLASILQTAGLKTGLYTSPHLKDFSERIKINGQPVEKEFVVDFVRQNNDLIETIEPSFFELTVAMAMSYFREMEVDIAIIEVGLGGRLDSTNIIQPILNLITNIGLDHTDMLGDTHEKIAYEKGGIIKAQTPVVISEYREDTAAVFQKIADERDAAIYFAKDHFELSEKKYRYQQNYFFS